MVNMARFDLLSRSTDRRPGSSIHSSPPLRAGSGLGRPKLMRSLGLLGILASVSVASQLAPAPVAAAASPRIAGVVTVAPGATLPTSFQLRRLNGMMATVNVPATAPILLRYGGSSAITAITTGDHLVLFGQFEAGNATFDATRVQDMNVQRVNVDTRAVVSSVNATSNTISVHTTGYNSGSPLRGNVTIDVPAGATMPFANGTTVPDVALQRGDVLMIGGLYNTRTHTLLSASSIRGLRLVAAAVSLTPITLSLHGSAYRRQHFVTVHVHTVANAFIRVILRYNGRQRVFTGRAGMRGYYTARRFLAYGYWPRPHLVRAVIFVSSGSERARASTHAYIA